MHLSENAHDALFSPATLRLGEAYWYVLKAANLMESQRYKVTKTGKLGFTTTETTAFGKEVGQDEINWWVFKKERIIGELQKRTENALEAAQLLKEQSVKLTRKFPESYDALLSSLEGFTKERADEIEALYDYVRWLQARDVLAPSILFTYRVWGDTRMGERWVKIAADVLVLSCRSIA